MPAPQEPHRAVHLREQPRDRRLARARIAEEDEVLRRRHLRQPRLLPPRLHAQERDESANLLLDRLEAGQRVELREQLVERARRLLLAEEVELELFTDRGAELLPEVAQRFEWVGRHPGPRYPLPCLPMQGPMTR